MIRSLAKHTSVMFDKLIHSHCKNHNEHIPTLAFECDHMKPFNRKGGWKWGYTELNTSAFRGVGVLTCVLAFCVFVCTSLPALKAFMWRVKC